MPDCSCNPSGLAANSPAAFLLNPGQDVYCQFSGSFVSAGIRYTVEP